MVKLSKLKKLVCFCSSLFAFILIGCSDIIYSGEHPGEYTVAINSLLGADGYAGGGGPWAAQSEINILETDSYGRTLFYYNELPVTSGFLICQKTDDTYTYFYPDVNYVLDVNYILDEEGVRIEGAEFANEEYRTRLKEQNDWNLPFDENKCEKVEIVREKNRNAGIYRDEAYRIVIDELGLPKYIYLSFFKTDNYGREIYTFWGRRRGDDYNLVILVNPDGSFNKDTGYFMLTDAELLSYQDKLKALKDNNGWNEPFTPAE